MTPKLYLHHSEPDTWFVHVTKGEPLLSVHETFDPYRGLGMAIARKNPCTCFILFHPDASYLAASVAKDLDIWDLRDTEISMKVGFSYE